MEEAVVFRCETCGSVMEFDATAQMLTCPSCGASKEIAHHEEMVVEHSLTLDAKRKIKVEEKTTTTIQCSGCGAKIEVEQFDASVECPYCGSSYVLAGEQQEALIPDGVVPFYIDRQKVKELFGHWIKKRWFAPNELKTLYQRDKFVGVYLPYWTFDAKVNCSYTGRGGITRTEHYKDSEGKEQTRVKIDWYYVSGNMNHFFDDVAVAATKKFQNGFFKGIEPFYLKELKSYSKEYLSGYLAEQYSIDLVEGHEVARGEMRQELYQMAQREIEQRYDCSDSIQISPRFSKETYKYILVPIYSTSYHFKGKQYTVLINGQNGKIKGEYPKSPIKIAIAVLCVILLLVVVYLFSEAEDRRRAIAKEDEMQQTVIMMEQEDIYEIEL